MNEELAEIWTPAEQTSFGGWITSSSTLVLDCLLRAGLDFVGMDCQHGYLDETDAARLLERFRNTSVAGVVRVSANDPALIGRVADAGADGIIVPDVSTPQEAEDLVSAIRFPPRGERSFGPMRQDLDFNISRLEQRVSLFPMIETEEGLANLAETCGVAGVAGVYVGPVDMCISLGRDPLAAFAGDVIAEELERVVRACEDARIVPGIHAKDVASARGFVDRGFRLVTLGSDKRLLVSAFADAVATLRADPKEFPEAGGSGPY